MRQNGVLHIFRKVVHNGIEIQVGRRDYNLAYPVAIWQAFPEVYRQTFADTLAYFLTRHLAFTENHKLLYHFPPPGTEPFYFQGMIYSMGETSLVADKSVAVSSLLKQFYNSQFQTQFVGRPRYARFKNVNRNNWTRTVIPFSFGKDSLLTYALSDELGIKPYPIFFREPKSPIENKHKARLAQRFFDEFDVDVLFFPVAAGWLRQNSGAYWGWDMMLTQYTLMMVPFVFGIRSRYLFWAHEQSCNDVFEDDEGYIINPVYEQSHNWLLLSNATAKMLGCNAVFASLIEPIHELAIMKILHARYPDIGKYQMSCFAEEESAKNKRWCGKCSKCARMYIFMMALGIDPKRVGFTQSMLTRNKRNLFSIFLDRKRTKDSAYGESGAGRDEQLLAFLMAHRRRVKGDLIDEFAKKYLREAKGKEGKMREKFFGIHSTDTLTYELKKPLLKIFEEELRELR
jgi:hypothetical protein